MDRDELEFSISQYLDGSLPPLESAALEERLARDEDARAVLAEYQRLDAALRSSAGVPGVNWDALERRVSESLSSEEPPVRHYRIGTWRAAAGAALAACLVLAAGVAFLLLRDDAPDAPSVASHPAPVIVVVGPQVERPADTEAVAQVSIGPAPTMSDSWRYTETVISRPTVVMIERAAAPVHDSDGMWN